MTRVWVGLVDPVGAMRRNDRAPIVGMLLGLLLVVVVLGAATIPRQLSLLSALLPADPEVAEHVDRLTAGIRRLVYADRLLPPVTPLLAAVFLFGMAETVLALPRDRRRALVAVLIIGLAPLGVLRAGELAVTYLIPADALVAAGDAVGLPGRFVVGPRLVWRADLTWLHVIDQRANLVTFWCVGLWALGLRELDGRTWADWHVILPLIALVSAGIATWLLTPVLLPIVLRG